MSHLCSSPTLHMKQILKTSGSNLLKYSVATSSATQSTLPVENTPIRRYNNYKPNGSKSLASNFISKLKKDSRIVQKVENIPTSTDKIPQSSSRIHRDTISLILDKFLRNETIKKRAESEYGIGESMFVKTFLGFRIACLELCVDVNKNPGLVEKFRLISKSGKHENDLLEDFANHAKTIFPHLSHLDDLRMVSDMTKPHNWYPIARQLKRRIVFHAGPTNSGKTWNALQAFKNSESGVYCGPLRLLANEIFRRMNKEGHPCDLVTGEERRFAIDNMNPAKHLSCTVEMLPTDMTTGLAVIDEIQMLRDEQRGWAWTRALLGAAADEIHLCGEASAIPIVKKLLAEVEEEVEVNVYERKSKLTMSTHALGDLSHVQDGDCIVCFNKRAIFMTSKDLELSGKSCAVIYGDLPPGTKIRQAEKFNDPNDPTKVLVATDAIGMGLNLNIKRVIFDSIKRMNEVLPHHLAKQIAGRAGRYGTAYDEGLVTTRYEDDLETLKELLDVPIGDIEKVGIAPTFDQIETFAFLLKDASFYEVLQIFKSVCSVSDDYFLCNIDQTLELAKSISDIPLPLLTKYNFSVVPINLNNKQNMASFVKIVKRFANGQTISADWFTSIISWPPKVAVNMDQLVGLERTYDILDAYLWLAMRYSSMFPDDEIISDLQKELDQIITESIKNVLTKTPKDELNKVENGDEKPKSHREELKNQEIQLARRRRVDRKTLGNMAQETTST